MSQVGSRERRESTVRPQRTQEVRAAQAGERVKKRQITMSKERAESMRVHVCASKAKEGYIWRVAS